MGVSFAEVRRAFRWEDAVAALDWDATRRLNLAHEACDRWARDRGRVALVWAGAAGDARTFTYFELGRLASRLANVLRRAGIGRGDRVAALMPRLPEAYVASLAVWKLGAIFVPLFTGFGPDAIRHRLAASGARAIVTEGRHRELLARGLHEDVPALVVAGERGRGLRRGDLSFWAEVERADPAFATVETRPDEPCTLMFTSGTTGPPKGCIIPHGALVGLIPFVQHVLALGPDDLLWATADPGWAFGLFTTGAVPMALGHPRLVYEGDFNARAWWRVAEEHQVTHLTGAPTAYRSLVAAGEEALAGRALAIRRATSAGEPLNPEPIRWLAEHAGFDVYDSYGLTEVGMVTGNPRTVAHRLKAGSMGFPLPGYDVALLDASGREVPPHQTGTIAVRRHAWFLSSGYWEMDDAWAARWQDDEWFLTGDAAHADEDGYLWFVARQDDVIVSSGMNVGPFEVESVLVAHPAVAEAAVVGVPDARRGHAIKAYVVLRDAARGGPELAVELQDAVRQQVGRHAAPREVEFAASLPRTESGKIQRALLRRPAAESAVSEQAPADGARQP
ncbi:MAG: acyl-CoA synthetase [Candidatus Rokuibacteriota bacterium]